MTTPADACRAAAVCTAFRSVADSDTVWEKFLPSDCDAILERAVHLVDFSSKKELFLDLAQEHILLDDGKMSFGLQRSYGAKCYMMSGSQLLDIAWICENIYWTKRSDPDSRFSKVAELLSVCWFCINGSINSRELSPSTHYAGYLVFKLTQDASGLSSPRQISFVEVGRQLVGSACTVSLHPCKHASCSLSDGGETSEPHEHKEEGGVMVRYPRHRVDDWLELEMGDFHTDTSYDAEDVKMEQHEFEELEWKRGLIIEGIE
ncbi:putative F-box protein PP2-B12 [Lolium perenne]|nr:putative F-box protein PP2-B12 [Lolium perenne]